MQFINKRDLKETDTNPLETNGLDLSYDEQYKQAILKAIGSEVNASVEYDQIIALEPKVSNKDLVERFHELLIHLRDEEIGHVSALTTKVSEIPDMKVAFEAGKKEAEGKEHSSEDKEDKEDNTDKEDKEDKEDNEEPKEEKEDEIKEAIDNISPNEIYGALESTKLFNSKELEYIKARLEELSDEQIEVADLDDVLEYLKVNDIAVRLKIVNNLNAVENALISYLGLN